MSAGAVEEDFRRYFQRFTTGVAVVATTGEGEPMGMTVNSVASLSLAPLLLLFCARNGSATTARIVESGCFSVNLLTADQESVSRHYAGASQSGGTWTWGEAHGIPFLEGSNASFLCHLDRIYPGGDHRILVGLIVGMRGPEVPLTPLLFHGGRYARLPLPGTDEPGERAHEDIWWVG